MDSLSDFFWNKTKRQQEEDVVNHLLKRYGLAQRWKQVLLKLREQEEGERGLALRQFHQLFPSFPIQFAMSDCPKPADMNRFTQMLTKFTQSSMAREYWEQRDDNQIEDVPFGLVMKWPYLRPEPGVLVLHDFSTSLDDTCSRLVVGMGQDCRPLVLECLPNVLDAIDLQTESIEGTAWYDVAQEMGYDQS